MIPQLYSNSKIIEKEKLYIHWKILHLDGEIKKYSVKTNNYYKKIGLDADNSRKYCRK